MAEPYKCGKCGSEVRFVVEGSHRLLVHCDKCDAEHPVAMYRLREYRCECWPPKE